MRYDNKTFSAETIFVCGNQYYGCTFQRCKFVFSGRAPYVIDGCHFDEPPCWFYDGPALETIRHFTTLYHKLGEAGMREVEATFTNIRLDKFPVLHDDARSTQRN